MNTNNVIARTLSETKGTKQSHILQLTLSVSPHIRSSENVTTIMRDVIIALIPAAVAGICFFGLNAALTIIVSILFCIAGEYLSVKIMRRESPLNDLSAVVTGVLFAFVLPPGMPLWVVAIGALISIIFGKMIFGGLGQNIFNPALVGRAILLASWPVFMTSWNLPFESTTTATPLAIVRMKLNQPLPSYWQMFIGERAGSLGETSVLALILGATYLFLRRHITWHIPFSFICLVFILSTLLKRDPLFEIMAGGVILGAFFMATDYVTSPLTRKGQLIFGAGCGLMTVLIRHWGGFPEGVCYAILIMNMVTPLIDMGLKTRGHR
ncbi:MAG: RnfABCDGE type electron transport complex subunit D [Elusimicrobiota bacterium]